MPGVVQEYVQRFNGERELQATSDLEKYLLDRHKVPPSYSQDPDYPEVLENVKQRAAHDLQALQARHPESGASELLKIVQAEDRKLLANYWDGYDTYKAFFEERFAKSDAQTLESLQATAHHLRFLALNISDSFRNEAHRDPFDPLTTWLDRYKDGALRAVHDAYWEHKPEVKQAQEWSSTLSVSA